MSNVGVVCDMQTADKQCIKPIVKGRLNWRVILCTTYGSTILTL